VSLVFLLTFLQWLSSSVLPWPYRTQYLTDSPPLLHAMQFHNFTLLYSPLTALLHLTAKPWIPTTRHYFLRFAGLIERWLHSWSLLNCPCKLLNLLSLSVQRWMHLEVSFSPRTGSIRHTDSFDVIDFAGCHIIRRPVTLFSFNSLRSITLC
jgi:hypothetical protein